jgi:hypothetical protein
MDSHRYQHGAVGKDDGARNEEESEGGLGSGRYSIDGSDLKKKTR